MIIQIKVNIEMTSLNNKIASILITDDVNQKCVDILENNNFLVKKNIKLTKAELLDEIKVNLS